MGISATVDEIFSSAYAAAVYISRVLDLTGRKEKEKDSEKNGEEEEEVVEEGKKAKNKVFVVGEAGIDAELDIEGVRHIGGADPAFRREITTEDYVRIAERDPRMLDPEVGVVLVGLDSHPNYLKLALAYHYITGPNKAIFLATNLDATVPVAGTLFPGAGTTSAPLIRMLAGSSSEKNSSNNDNNNNNISNDKDHADNNNTTGSAQPLTLGKPSQAMLDAIDSRFHLDRSRVCMVGDRLDTDIRFGIDGGLGGTLAVLTGVTTKDEILRAGGDGDGDGDGKEEREGEERRKKIQPSAFIDKLSDLLFASRSGD